LKTEPEIIPSPPSLTSQYSRNIISTLQSQFLAPDKRRSIDLSKIPSRVLATTDLPTGLLLNISLFPIIHSETIENLRTFHDPSAISLA
jgi:hypothetical protein